MLAIPHSILSFFTIHILSYYMIREGAPLRLGLSAVVFWVDM